MENLKCFKIVIDHPHSDEETIILPLQENLDKYGVDTLEELKETIEKEEWGYGNYVTVIPEELNILDFNLTNVNPSLIDEDAEVGVMFYSDLAYGDRLYDRPFDEVASDSRFCSLFTYDCMVGGIYSKSFMYSRCDSCDRMVCEQNPSNGWMSQVHLHDGWAECNKCYEERVLENGVNEDFDGSTIPGQFFNDSDVEQAGWVKQHDGLLAGSGYSGYKDPQYILDILQEYADNDVLFLVVYENMAIGGLGGYVSIYTKGESND